MPTDATTAVPSTAPQQQRPRRLLCTGDDYAVLNAATSTSYRPAAHVDPAALGIADFVADAELSRTTSTQLPPPDGTGSKNTRTAVAVETDEFAEFHPFSPSGVLPRLSPCLNADTWGSDSSVDGGKQPQRRPPPPQPQRRRHRHGSTDSFTPSTSPDDTGSSSGSNSAQKPSPHAIATAFTPIWKGGKIERTKELMERVALAKAQFRARQLAAATARCQDQRE